MMDDDADIVWEGTLDDRYRVSVKRLSSHTGWLVVTDVQGGEELLAEETGLMYGARFGPDVEDVRSWQERAVQVVDARGGG